MVRQRRTVVDAKIEAIRAKKQAAQSAAELARTIDDKASGNIATADNVEADESMLREAFKTTSISSITADPCKYTLRDNATLYDA